MGLASSENDLDFFSVQLVYQLPETEQVIEKLRYRSESVLICVGAQGILLHSRHRIDLQYAWVSSLFDLDLCRKAGYLGQYGGVSYS